MKTDELKLKNTLPPHVKHFDGSESWPELGLDALECDCTHCNNTRLKHANKRKMAAEEFDVYGGTEYPK